MTSLLILLVQRGQPIQTGLLLGFAVHFKIYPIIYTPTILFAMDEQYDRLGYPRSEVKAYKVHQPTTYTGILSYINRSRVVFSIAAAFGFLVSTAWMYYLYDQEFVQHTYLHYFSRVDHRHNFSPYHLTLYLFSAAPKQTWSISLLAFIPQLVLAGVIMPLALYGKDLATTMFAQTFAFVAFNKVCTSQVCLQYLLFLMQYFMWYMSFLPLYLPTSPFLQSRIKGISALAAWIIAQVC
jgi:GPI mannosyltransferase 1 subunit M